MMMNKQLVTVKDISSVSSHIYRISLNFEKRFPFRAGQYLKLWLDSNICRPYSIASPSNTGYQIDIFVGCHDHNSVAMALIKSMHATNKILVSLPYGNAFYRNNKNQQITIVVSGSGYAYGKSIALEALLNNKKKRINFLWLIQDKQDLFEIDVLLRLRKKYENFEFLIYENKTKEVTGEENELNNFLRKNLISNKTDVYLAGSSMMTSVFKKVFFDLGIDIEHIYTDS
jgi:NAD(P)H-flavin reductase